MPCGTFIQVHEKAVRHFIHVCVRTKLYIPVSITCGVEHLPKKSLFINTFYSVLNTSLLNNNASSIESHSKLYSYNTLCGLCGYVFCFLSSNTFYEFACCMGTVSQRWQWELPENMNDTFSFVSRNTSFIHDNALNQKYMGLLLYRATIVYENKYSMTTKRRNISQTINFSKTYLSFQRQYSQRLPMPRALDEAWDDL